MANPLNQISNLVSQAVSGPVGALTDAVHRPSSVGRHRPLYGLNVLDALRGKSLENSVKDKVTLITGASSGIGATTAIRIGAAGGEVVLVARGREKLEETAKLVEAAGGKAHVYPCDLSDMDAIPQMAQQVQADLGQIDILVNNAGRSIRRSLELSYDRFHDYERTMQLNYFAPVRLCLEVLPGMRERGFGHVVNVSSIGVQTRAPRFGAYVASKAALDMLCDTWQAETRDDGVRFSTVHMVLVRTPMISATTIYQKFPALTPDEAADVLADAIVHQPRRVSPAFGHAAAFADAISPQFMDMVRGAGFKMFPDSKAARGEGQPAPAEAPVADGSLTPAAKIFTEVTRGNHW
ncbi:SDR family NAD(P)-dependent oxidoreductase [Nocardioides cavernaquae]|uniref:SDR family NAD(P)-dependent oxidoreductase n=1 Tax=Nocardioides cavernaquae TaxID=2321396 RepID=A0A3A5H8X6_9ACTN|nr:SDR family NAD(P)-dependent oxidoreductase [Nocardioides cavernaquae]RJS45835.1 SDR family NAD(P)-dependent oxidoreductase [Nocardioides cavernaquae]